MQAVARHPLMVVHADTAEYRELAAAEARFWAQPHAFGLEVTEDTFASGPIDLHNNARYTGDPKVEWSQAVSRYGHFRRGLMLGVGSPRAEVEILRTNPDLHLTLVDISPGAVERRCAELSARFPKRVDGQVADLNFLELPADAYDLIVSCGTIHHVTNLEYLATTLNQALVADGRFCLQDYVGEPRFQMRDEKKRLYELIFDRDIARIGGGRRPGVRWRDDSDLSPFCGVRSDDILPVLRRSLRELEVHTAGALTIALMRSEPADGATFPPLTGLRLLRGRIRQKLIPLLGGMAPMSGLMNSPMIDELLLVGDIATDAGLIQPGTAFAVYGKR